MSTNHSQDPSKTLVLASEEVLKDESFYVPSPLAQEAIRRGTGDEAIRAATTLPFWSKDPENQQDLDHFSSYIESKLKEVFPQRRNLSTKTRREKMWRNYHIVCTTDEFTSRWCSFLKNKVKVDTACPTLYQYMYIMHLSMYRPTPPLPGSRWGIVGI